METAPAFDQVTIYALTNVDTSLSQHLEQGSRTHTFAGSKRCGVMTGSGGALMQLHEQVNIELIFVQRSGATPSEIRSTHFGRCEFCALRLYECERRFNVRERFIQIAALTLDAGDSRKSIRLKVAISHLSRKSKRLATGIERLCGQAQRFVDPHNI